MTLIELLNDEIKGNPLRMILGEALGNDFEKWDVNDNKSVKKPMSSI